MNIADILSDLLAEQAALDPIVRALSDTDWTTPTASPRWTVTDQIAHLTFFDEKAAVAIESPEGWDDERSRLFSAGAGGDSGVDELTLTAVRELPPGERHAAWERGRGALERAANGLAEDVRVPWYGPSMGAKSFLTARLMECWAHGQDVIDAVGADRPATDRLRHVAQLGYATRGWAYVNRGETPPEGEVQLRLTAPSGATWTWGPDDADARVQGSAEDFCLVVTQRRHLDDVSLTIEGAAAIDWLSKAQAFAGPPTAGPRPGAFRQTEPPASS